MDCIFCKIIKGEISSLKIFEDEHCLVFLDIHPSVKGHALVIPKTHYDNWLATPENILAEIARVSKLVAKAAIKGLEADGFNIGVNTGLAAGQVIKHTHLHILPRYHHDGLRLWPSKEMNQETLEQIAAQLKSAL